MKQSFFKIISGSSAGTLNSEYPIVAMFWEYGKLTIVDIDFGIGIYQFKDYDFDGIFENEHGNLKGKIIKEVLMKTKEITPIVRIWYESFRAADGLEVHYGDGGPKREGEDFPNCWFKREDNEYLIMQNIDDLVAVIPKKNVHSIRKMKIKLRKDER